jgi:RNA polymerase sigma-70 factor (ECF subfamily)
VNDDELMQRIAQGHQEAFRLLVERWEKAIFGFAYQMLHSVEESEDLSQDVFLRVYAQAKRYRPAGRFRSWLFRIAGNLARSRLRRRRVVGWVSFDASRHDRADARPLPDADLKRQRLQQAVQGALAKLPVRQREAVVLRRYQGLSYKEIAEVMDTTNAAVESLLQRAAAALRDELAGKVLGT